MVTLRLLGLLATLVACSSFARAAPLYPANPFITGKDIFVSVDGVIRMEHETLEPVWFALEGLKTDAPVVSGETVLVGTNAGMFALGVDDGMVRWHIPSATALQSPVVSDEVAFVSGADGSVHAVAVADGSRLWRRSMQGALQVPAVAGERLVVGGEQGTLWALDTEDGRSHWELALENELAVRPVADERGQIYVCTVAARLMAVDGKTGRRAWQQTLSSPGSVLVDRQRVYVGQFDGEVSARSRENGTVVWKKALPGLGSVPLRLLGEALVATTDSGETRFLDPASGEAIEPSRRNRDPQTDDPPSAPPPLADDVLVRSHR